MNFHYFYKIGLWIIFCLFNFNFIQAAQLSNQTYNFLLKKYHIELIQNDKEKWTEFEGQAFINLLQTIPLEIAQILITHNLPNLKIQKILADSSSYQDNLKKHVPIKNITIPIYSSEKISSFEQNSNKTSEKIQFIQKHNLISPYPKSNSKNHNYLKELENHTNYLLREFLKSLIYLYDQIYQNSNKEEWRRLSGWKEQKFFGISIGFKNADNQYIRGYAHPSGLYSPIEDFATFGASYFIPPITAFSESIKCRLPNKYEFFKKRFPSYQAYLDHPEFTKRGIFCPTFEKDFAGNFIFKDLYYGKEIDIGLINNQTVTGFELLYAMPGDKEISEIAGHLLLRIKLDNNPEAQKYSLENPYDLVVALLADSNPEQTQINPQNNYDKNATELDECKRTGDYAGDHKDYKSPLIQALKGLSGFFPTTFQIDTLQYIKQVYTVKGNRTIKRYRFNLTRAQQESLIRHLYWAKNQYKANYYFFTDNCASVLIRLIGQGINNKEIAEFSPITSPPNSLIALLERKEIISEISPAFYSYTAKAQIAQDIINEKLIKLSKKFPKENWPNKNFFLKKDPHKRIQVYSKLYDIAVHNPKTRQSILYIFSVAQRSELLFTWNEGECISYSTDPKGIIRQYWKNLKQISQSVPEFNLEQTINYYYNQEDIIKQNTNSFHTRLSSIYFGSRFSTSQQANDLNQFFLGSTIYKQDFGDISQYAMGRSTFVELGKFEISINTKHSEKIDDIQWSITGLKVQKIKERLNYVPSIFSVNRKIGLGFTVLSFSRPLYYLENYRTILAEGTTFISLISSPLFNNYLILGLGFGIETPWQKTTPWSEALYNNDRYFTFPILLEGLLTFKNIKTRTTLEYKYIASELDKFNQNDITATNLLIHSDLLFNLGEFNKNEILLLTGLKYQNIHQNIQKQFYSSFSISLGLEFNRW